MILVDFSFYSFLFFVVFCPLFSCGFHFLSECLCVCVCGWELCVCVCVIFYFHIFLNSILFFFLFFNHFTLLTTVTFLHSKYIAIGTIILKRERMREKKFGVFSSFIYQFEIYLTIFIAKLFSHFGSLVHSLICGTFCYCVFLLFLLMVWNLIFFFLLFAFF